MSLQISNHLQAAWRARILAALDPSEVSTRTPEDFAREFHGVMANHPFHNHVSEHSPDEIRSEQMTPLTTNEGKTGLLVHNHGDGRIEATGLYNQSEVPKAGRDLLRHAVEHHGVNYVEAYGPVLPKMYNQVGFHTTEQYHFDRSQAAPDWDFKRFDSPNYHIMHLRGASKMARIADDGVEEWNPDGSDEHWDDPKWVAALRAKIEAEVEAEDPEWFAAHRHQMDDHWAAALFAFGVAPASSK